MNLAGLFNEFIENKLPSTNSKQRILADTFLPGLIRCEFVEGDMSYLKSKMIIQSRDKAYSTLERHS